MNRCIATSSIKTLFIAAAAVTSLLQLPAAHAQDDVLQGQPEAAVGGRVFPMNALRGEISFGAPPAILLDGQAARLSPGVRVQSAQRMLTSPASLAGQSFAVNYTREATSGMVNQIWILNNLEAGTKRAGAPKPFFNFWPFVANTGPRDDGTTPYNQLPGYGQ
ncbi:hypothetical protein [Variovorax sp. OV329]|uniref:hypothetical protein n=1 Tax=Variovorax sp. OV329 TaxID=1882825 RepID=UPI0008ED3A0D|nr:hypothetical protein [Variovorax sp. OV329]SFM76819.1 hypothetical protein SAMN05444747_108211 [Variovorax sp. OV329]